MERIQVATQQELDAVLAQKDKLAVLVGSGWFKISGSAHVVAWGSAHVVAWGSVHVEAWGSAHVVAWGSVHVEAWGSVHVEAWGSVHVVARGSVHVEAWGSVHVEAWGSVHVVARESAHVEAWGSAHVEAWGSAHVVARESAHVVAQKWNSVHKMFSHHGTVTGGVVVEQPKLATVEDWCAYHGVPITNGVVVLYKALNDNFCSQRGGLYLPGTTPKATDWDGGKAECGGGLHFSPSPCCALEFHAGAKRFVACPVAIVDIRPPQPDDDCPQKVKASGCCGPVWECDRSGKPVAKVPEQETVTA